MRIILPLKRSNSVVKSRLGVPMGAVTESCDLCLLPLIVKLNKNVKKYGNPGDSLGPHFWLVLWTVFGTLGPATDTWNEKSNDCTFFPPHCANSCPKTFFFYVSFKHFTHLIGIFMLIFCIFYGFLCQFFRGRKYTRANHVCLHPQIRNTLSQ